MKFEVFEISGKDFIQFEQHQDLALADVHLLDILPTWSKIRIAFFIRDKDLSDVAPSDQFIDVVVSGGLLRRGSDLTDGMLLPLLLAVVSRQWLTRNAELERVATVAFEHEANFSFLIVLDAHRRKEKHVLDLDRAAVGMFFESCSRHLQVSDTRHNGGAADAMLFENPLLVDAELRHVNVLVVCLRQTAFQQGMTLGNGIRGGF